MADSDSIKLCCHGHQMTPDNIHIRHDRGTPVCRTCMRLRVSRYRKKVMARSFSGAPCACGCGQPTRDTAHTFLAGHYQNRRGNSRHGHSPAGRPSPTYQSWQDMHKRCRNPQNKGFADYGGRGIRICERWHDFATFLNDMGEKPPGMTLDRIDNDGHYEPGNCRWATRHEQNNNRRNNRYFTAFGKTQNVAAWASQFGVSWMLVYNRVFALGWNGEDALMLPRDKSPYRCRGKWRKSVNLA